MLIWVIVSIHAHARAWQLMKWTRPAPLWSLQLDCPAGNPRPVREQFPGNPDGDLNHPPRRGKRWRGPPTPSPSSREARGGQPFPRFGIGSPGSGLACSGKPGTSPDTGVEVPISLLPSPQPCPGRDQGGTRLVKTVVQKRTPPKSSAAAPQDTLIPHKPPEGNYDGNTMSNHENTGPTKMSTYRAG